MPTFCNFCYQITNFYNKYLAKKSKKQDENKLSKEIIEQIKDFEHSYDAECFLTAKQWLLVNKLIPNIKLKERYEYYGLCQECQQPRTYYDWCKNCNTQHFQQAFKNWTNDFEINKFIQRQQLEAINNNVLEWIPYNNFTDKEYLTEGGFGKVYRAKWIDGNILNWSVNENKWNRYRNREVILKVLNNSQNMTVDFLQETTYHKLFDLSDNNQIVLCYGISQDPVTKDYLMVMRYITYGSLRKFLNENYEQLELKDKLRQLLSIVNGLKSIHDKGLVHRDFHTGNILSDEDDSCCITDLGLCRPASEVDQNKIYGVLPYMAPEVLRDKNYTQAADIYSFGIVIYEVLSGLPPYCNLPHDVFLILKICQGLRPNLNNIIAPQLLKDLIKQCWDAEMLQRPTSSEIEKKLVRWRGEIHKKGTELFQQCKEIEEFSRTTQFITRGYKIHPHAIYTSRLLDFKNLPKSQNSEEINNEFYSQLIDFTESNIQEKVFEKVQEVSEQQSQIIHNPPKPI